MSGVKNFVITAILIAFFLPAFVWAENDTQGFIYGKITTRKGSTYEGRMRWNGDEEAFWGDHFNATKEDRDYLDEVPEKKRRRDDRDSISIMGIRIGTSGWYSSGRSLVARFGDIKTIEVRRSDEATLTMKSGEKYEIDGGSNDVGGRIYIWDNEVGEIKIDWDRIDLIEFMPTPANIDIPVKRLHGKIETDAGDFEGYIQWDKEECLSSDELDGESDDGDLEIPMGNIRSIERLSRRSSLVTLRSGREIELDGTNDVNHENRGIFVEDPRYGRVLVTWDAFERVDFSQLGPSGPSYDEFAPAKPLRGTVIDLDGRRHTGRIIYDIDEAETWELLNGDRRDLEYNIPFSLIKSISPKGSDSSRIILKGGEDLILEDAADVGDGHDGILVLSPEGDPSYIPWDDVDRVDFGG